jgi:hypothetical protein
VFIAAKRPRALFSESKLVEEFTRVSRDGGRASGHGLSRSEVAVGSGTLGEGHMIRVFVALSWAAYALRRILTKPVKALAGR